MIISTSSIYGEAAAELSFSYSAAKAAVISFTRSAAYELAEYGIRPVAITPIRLALPKLGYLELGQSGRGPLSTGAVDIVGVVRGALEAGYSGRFGVEAFAPGILPPWVDDALAIWRDPYSSPAELAADAAQLVRRGYDLSAQSG